MEERHINTLVKKIKEAGKNTPPDVVTAINDIGFRLLEQVRLNNKENVFYLLLRCFKAKEQKFPDDLIEVFKPENERYFKTLVFTFLASVLERKQARTETEGGES